jgi:hypothetical protein
LYPWSQEIIERTAAHHWMPAAICLADTCLCGLMMALGFRGSHVCTCAKWWVDLEQDKAG